MTKGEHGGENPITLFSAITTYLGYATLIIFGRVRDFVGIHFGLSRYKSSFQAAKDGYAPFSFSFENFYTRRMYHRIQDCFNRPFTGPPGARISVVERTTRDGVVYEANGDSKTKDCLNLGSYNYLGFADDWNSTCKDFVFEAFEDYSVGTCSPRLDCGTNALHKELEDIVADFVGKEAAFVFNMGYATNFTVIPALMGPGSLIISDSLNHASIVNGARGSGAVIRVFKVCVGVCVFDLHGLHVRVTRVGCFHRRFKSFSPPSPPPLLDCTPLPCPHPHPPHPTLSR
jgi:serine palmitoyltransferase